MAFPMPRCIVKLLQLTLSPTRKRWSMTDIFLIVRKTRLAAAFWNF